MLHLGKLGAGIRLRYVYMYVYTSKSSVMAVLGCNGLRCVINIILSVYTSQIDIHTYTRTKVSSALNLICDVYTYIHTYIHT
jgi:hypothetical protein